MKVTLIWKPAGNWFEWDLQFSCVWSVSWLPSLCEWPSPDRTYDNFIAYKSVDRRFKAKSNASIGVFWRSKMMWNVRSDSSSFVGRTMDSRPVVAVYTEKKLDSDAFWNSSKRLRVEHVWPFFAQTYKYRQPAAKGEKNSPFDTWPNITEF